MRGMIMVLTVALLAIFAVGAVAATWTHVGTAGFSKVTPSQLQDRKRPVLNSMVKDEAGNIWVSCSYDAAEIPGQGFYPHGSGVTVFKAGGGTVSVDVNALGYASCITKLVVSKASDGGDGAVYALLNYSNLEWTTYAQFQDYILRLKLESNNTISVTEIYTPGAQGTIWTQPVVNKIGGMAAGGDGNIYWTQNAVNSNWRLHFFWRYNTMTQAIEEAPNRDGLIPECASETHRLLDLEYLGNDQFAIVGAYYNSKWQCNSISWTVPARLMAGNYSEPTWGRKWNTANAYDPLRKKMWIGGRGEIAYYEWTKAGAGGTVVDLGGGNSGIKMVSNGAVNEYYTNDKITCPSAQLTGAARFRVEAYSGDPRTILWQYGSSSKTTDGKGLAVALKIIGGNFKIVDLYAGSGNSVLADLGPVVLNAWNDLYIYIDSQAATSRVNWNGTEVYNGPIGYQSGKNWKSWLEFGDLTGSGSSTITYDWVGQATGYVAPGEMPAKYWLYIDGSKIPSGDPYFLGSNIMTRFDGDPLNPSIFDNGGTIGTYNTYPLWHANGYDELNNPTPGKRLGGMYWISALAVNPYSGEAWVAWGADASYTYDATDHVRSIPVTITGTKPTLTDQGVPEPGAQIHSLMFDGGTVYALTCNLTSGAYNVYSTTVSAPGPMPVAGIKNLPAGAMVQTDSPKVVTYPDAFSATTFFYIEDDDRSGAIRVIPQADQPIGVLGQRASVKGFTGVVNGEAVIYATSVTLSDTSDTIAPLGVVVRNVGGKALGVQPATLAGDSTSSAVPASLNTTGLLIRVAGVLKMDYTNFAEYIDDGSGYPLLIDYPSGTGAYDGDKVAVTGISTVRWDSTTGKAYRTIAPRNSDDIKIY